MTKAPTLTEKSKKQRDNTKTPLKICDYTTIAEYQKSLQNNFKLHRIAL